jgi:hypothetical protein
LFSARRFFGKPSNQSGTVLALVHQHWDKIPEQNKETSMAIQKKSLISTLKTTKKANVAKEESPATKDGVTTRKVAKFANQQRFSRFSKVN